MWSIMAVFWCLLMSLRRIRAFTDGLAVLIRSCLQTVNGTKYRQWNWDSSADTYLADHLSELEEKTFLSNSDAHSLAKIARNIMS